MCPSPLAGRHSISMGVSQLLELTEPELNGMKNLLREPELLTEIVPMVT